MSPSSAPTSSDDSSCWRATATTRAWATQLFQAGNCLASSLSNGVRSATLRRTPKGEGVRCEKGVRSRSTMAVARTLRHTCATR
eukprot:2435706-Prymnesium_polylepis.1